MSKESRTSRRQGKRRNKTNSKNSIFKKLLMFVIIAVVFFTLAIGTIFIYFIATAPSLDPEKLDVAYASQFYDMDGEDFGAYGDEQRIKVTYEELEESEYLIDAITSTEDARFFKHHGIDLRRILGAIKANILHGFGSEGASTITQQVVENMFLTPEKSIKLKVQEQWLALKLERKYSKEEILEMYLNKIYYGSNAYGIKKAAEVYFDKENLSDLTLTESAMLAGLPQRPSEYNPFKNPEIMQKRVSTVLKLMVRHDKITEAQAKEANAVDVNSTLTDKKPETNQYDAFMEKVEDELIEQLDTDKIFSSGLKVYTTLDRKAQEHVEFLLTDSDENPINYPDEDQQAGLTVIDTQSGAVRAIGGGRNREAKNFNYAYNNQKNSGRQPGSVFKPIVAYGPAIEYEKWSTYHQLNDDKPFQKGTSEPIPNVDRTNRGWVSMRTALKDSINVVAAKTFDEIGSERAKEFAEGLGIQFNDEILDPRDAVGGTSTNATPTEIASAYAAFGNEGMYTEPFAVEKVEFPDGTVMEMSPESEVAMEDYTAYMITDMLKSVVKSGTGESANIPNLPLAGKTGTTDNEEGLANNSWFSGYTTNYSVTVWSGYNDNSQALDTFEKREVAKQLFKETMSKISEDKETKDFSKPSSVLAVEIENGTNPPQLPSEYTPTDNIITELFVKGTEPTNTSKEYDKIEAVKNLQAKYNESKESIELSWDYDETEDIAFKVTYKNDKSASDSLTTEDTSIEVDGVEEGTTYQFEVIAKNTKSGLESDPERVELKIDDESLGSVNNLAAHFTEEDGSINVTWNYDGPADQFEVTLNNQSETTNSLNHTFSNITQSGSYTVGVTPIKDNLKGDNQTVNVEVNIEDSSDKEEENNNNANKEPDNNKKDEPTNNSNQPEKPKNPNKEKDEPSNNPNQSETPEKPNKQNNINQKKDEQKN